MSSEALGFFIGLFGSLHCASMCGPLVMALPLAGMAWWLVILQRALYQLGRILTYAILGIFVGFAGRGLHILGLQQVLSFITGFFLIAIALYHFSNERVEFGRLHMLIVTPIASLIGKWLAKPFGGLFAGMLHGLLPCGMVYMALAGSLSTASALTGSKFMFFFGLGTTPLLLIVSLLPMAFKRFKAPAAMLPVLYAVAGMFMLARGFNMDIPFVAEPVKIYQQGGFCE